MDRVFGVDVKDAMLGLILEGLLGANKKVVVSTPNDNDGTLRTPSNS